MQRLSYRFSDSYDVFYSFRDGDNVLVFLHGYLQAEIVWHPFIDILPKEFGIISIDLPGHGQTDCFGNNYFSLFSKAIYEILDFHNIAKVHLIGHSMGGYLALNIVKEFSNIVLSLTLLHSTPLPDTAMRIRNRYREIEIIENGKMEFLLMAPFNHLFAPANREGLVAYSMQYSKLALSVSAKAMVQSIISMADRGDYVAFCENFSLPIQMLVGRFDQMLLLSRVGECQALLPKIEYHILENSGHTCFIEEPATTKILLLNFINRAISR